MRRNLLKTSLCSSIKHPGLLVHNIPMYLEKTSGCFWYMAYDLYLLVSMDAGYYNYME